jgi:uncharacterized protein (UPF0264 family)
MATKLLVSVRSVPEALAALEGEADLIDVKEPSRGSLGRADDEKIAAVVAAVAGRRPVSAACGELLEHAPGQPGSCSLSYVKWGLAGCARDGTWPSMLDVAARRLLAHCQPVAVAYADWKRARSPSPANVCAFACERGWGAFLLDTWQKDGMTLLDHLELAKIDELVRRCHNAGVPVALAGSLDINQIKSLLPLGPDWFAVRGAVCAGRDRRGTVDAGRVYHIAGVVRNSRCVSPDPTVPNHRANSGGPRRPAGRFRVDNLDA